MSAGSSPVYLPVPRGLLLGMLALGVLAIALAILVAAQFAGHGPLAEPLLTGPIRWQGLSGHA